MAATCSASNANAPVQQYPSETQTLKGHGPIVDTWPRQARCRQRNIDADFRDTHEPASPTEYINRDAEPLNYNLTQHTVDPGGDSNAAEPHDASAQEMEARKFDSAHHLVVIDEEVHEHGVHENDGQVRQAEPREDDAEQGGHEVDPLRAVVAQEPRQRQLRLLELLLALIPPSPHSLRCLDFSVSLLLSEEVVSLEMSLASSSDAPFAASVSPFSCVDTSAQ